MLLLYLCLLPLTHPSYCFTVFSALLRTVSPFCPFILSLSPFVFHTVFILPPITSPAPTFFSELLTATEMANCFARGCVMNAETTAIRAEQRHTYVCVCVREYSWKPNTLFGGMAVCVALKHSELSVGELSVDGMLQRGNSASDKKKFFKLH